MTTEITDMSPINDEMGEPDYATIERINSPEMMICGTYLTTDLKTHRRFLEEFYGLETVCHRPGALLIRDRGRHKNDGHLHGGQYWVWEVEQTDTITHPQGVLNHWGVDVATKEEVTRSQAIGTKYKDRWGIKMLQKPKNQHSSWAYYMRDKDSNWFEVQWGERRSRLFAESGGFDPDYPASAEGDEEFSRENPVVRPVLMSHGTNEAGGDGTATRRFYAEFLGIVPRNPQRSPAYGVGTNREWYIACLARHADISQPIGNRWIYAVEASNEVDQFHETAIEYQEKYRIREIGDVIDEKGARYCRINDLDGQWWEYQWRDKAMGRWYDDEFAAGDVAVI